LSGEASLCDVSSPMVGAVPVRSLVLSAAVRDRRRIVAIGHPARGMSDHLEDGLDHQP